MHGPSNGYAAPVFTIGMAYLAFVTEDPGRFVALLFGFVAAFATVVRLYWDWQDRRATRHRPPPKPGRHGPRVSP